MPAGSQIVPKRERGEGGVSISAIVNPMEAIEALSIPNQCKLLIQQLGKIAMDAELNPEEWKSMQSVVRVINERSGYRFYDYNIGLPEDVAKKLGL